MTVTDVTLVVNKTPKQLNQSEHRRMRGNHLCDKPHKHGSLSCNHVSIVHVFISIVDYILI